MKSFLVKQKIPTTFISLPIIPILSKSLRTQRRWRIFANAVWYGGDHRPRMASISLHFPNIFSRRRQPFSNWPGSAAQPIAFGGFSRVNPSHSPFAQIASNNLKRHPNGYLDGPVNLTSEKWLS